MPAIVALCALVVGGLVGVAVWASGSPADLQVADPQPSQATGATGPTVTTAPTITAGPTITTGPTASGQQQSGGSPGGGQNQGGSATKPVIADFATSVDGLIVTVGFTVKAQADRGPFTCSVRRGSIDEFPCSPGPVERVYNFDYCCGAEIFVIATDGRGVKSDQYDGWVEFSRPDRAAYVDGSLSGWSEGDTVKIQFNIVAAPGDDPKCDVRIFQVIGSDGTSVENVWCEGPNIISFTGLPGLYDVELAITSDAYPSPPQWVGPIQVRVE